MPAVHVAVGVIVNDRNQVLIALRHPDKHQGGLWEFPGGKVEPGEATKDALGRELAEELGIVVDEAQPLLRVEHAYADKRVLLDVWRVTRFTGEALGQEGQSVRWVPATQLWHYPFPAANRPIIRRVALPEFVVITGEFADSTEFERRLHRAMARGAGMAYFRLPDSALQDKALLECAQALSRDFGLSVCAGPRWAERLGGATGLHLPASSLWSSPTRKELDYPLVGASCHNERELAQAVALDVDYVFLSPVRATQSHPDRLPLGFESFGELAREVSIPVYALGGLGPDDLSEVRLRSGHGIAAIGKLWD